MEAYMGRFNNPTRVGLRDRVTNELIVAFPQEVSGTDEEVYKKVFNWYSQQNSVLNSHGERNYFVDTITEDEYKLKR
jgi:hypothetical protein